MIPAQLSYFDFPFSRRAFCYGRGATSREVVRDGAVFRRYGRNVMEWTLVSIRPDVLGRLDNDPTPTLQAILREGGKIKTVNFTGDPPWGLFTIKGPTEFRIAGDFDTSVSHLSKKHRGNVRRDLRGVACRRVSPETGWLAVWDIFYTWIDWAKTRHFMVFKGHYERWLQMYLDTPGSSTVALYLIFRDGVPAAIFGGELDPRTGEAQITIAKHRPDLPVRALWLAGLRALLDEFHPTMVHCGSTADALKASLGMTPHPSWLPDLKAIRGSV